MQISLITCTNNSEKTIKDCCLSILSQTYENIEHIILDNQSNDETLDIAKKYKIKNQKIIQQKGVGLYSAINEGVKSANGDIIGILHSDDEFSDENIISNIIKKFSEHKINALFSNLFYISKSKKNKILRKWKSNLKNGIQSNELMFKKIHEGWMPPHTTLYIKKELINEIGLYNEKFKISSDYDFIIRLLKNENLNIFYMDEFTIKMKIGGMSNKNISNIILKMKEDFIIMKKHNLPPFKTIFTKNFSKISQFF